MKNTYTNNEQYYGDYLGLDKILNAQFPESEARNVEAHDEMLFIIIHQAYELWFKQLAYELNSIVKIFSNPKVDDNEADLYLVEHRLGRMVEIWKLLVDQVRIMETMTPMDFLDFRDLLTPASGFQSFQFRTLEAKLGLRMEHRHAQNYYSKQLRPEHLEQIESVEKEVSLFELIDNWLSRMPFAEGHYWEEEEYSFWSIFENTYKAGLSGSEMERISLTDFRAIFFGEGERDLRLSPAACRAALFINLYREYPILQTPFQILQRLLQIDELMSTWRYRHMIMVSRMIGMRSGTGGSSGAGYLKGAMESHQIFKDLARLATYLLPRHKVPKLPESLIRDMKFSI